MVFHPLIAGTDDFGRRKHGIVADMPHLHGIVENAADALFEAARGLRLCLNEGGKNGGDVRRGELGYRPFTNQRKCVLLQGIDDLLRGFGVGVAVLAPLVPLAGEMGKARRLSGSLPCFPSLAHFLRMRINALMQQGLRITMQLPYFFQADLRVGAKGQQAISATKAITKTPVFAAFVGQQQMKAATVEQFALFASCAVGVPYLPVGQFHWGFPLIFRAV